MSERQLWMKWEPTSDSDGEWVDLDAGPWSRYEAPDA